MPSMFSSIINGDSQTVSGMDVSKVWSIIKSLGAAANAIMGRDKAGKRIVEYGNKYTDALRRAGEHARLFPEAKKSSRLFGRK